jgi:CheY-like chemotaxis protein
VHEAGSGGAALDTLDRIPDIDLLLVDYAMPGMNGAEIAAAAAARRPGIPVMFITGYADLTALREIGEERILQKPFGHDELAAKLRRILSCGDVLPFSAAARKAS